MDFDFQKEARKGYFKYFSIWFLIVFVLLIATAAAGIRHYRIMQEPRANTAAPSERVYDEANLLTDEEEQSLRDYIAEKEAKYHIDFVVWTFDESLSDKSSLSDSEWNRLIMNKADDFWDQRQYGYNKGFEGDGSLLADCRYPGQRGEWLSTSGSVYEALSSAEIDSILYDVDEYYDSNPYKAYKAYIDGVCRKMGGGVPGFYYLIALVAAALFTWVYYSSHAKKNAAANTVAVKQYVVGGKPANNTGRDNLLHKNVTKRIIQTSSSGGRSGGGGGGHISSGGAHHGGGGHRH